jgi:drug/metabolite transporter (DMT)-like permease
MLALFAPALEIGVRYRKGALMCLLAGVLAAIVFALIGDIRRRPRPKALRVAALATFAGVVIGLLPPFASFTFRRFLRTFDVHMTPRVGMLLTLALAVFIGALMFGAYLAALTEFGLESTQAFTCLGLPGYKHFVRMRVRRDGSAIDAWVIGLVDPLDKDSKPELVDQFSWRPRD